MRNVYNIGTAYAQRVVENQILFDFSGGYGHRKAQMLRVRFDFYFVFILDSLPFLNLYLQCALGKESPAQASSSWPASA
jgi:hypothetical protein